MGVSLENAAGQHFYCRCLEWSAILHVALTYGWKPAGTQDPMDDAGEDWDGSYCSNGGQTVEAGDALALADALDWALLDPGTDVAPADDDFLATDRFPGPHDKERLQEFVTFCRGGWLWIT